MTAISTAACGSGRGVQAMVQTLVLSSIHQVIRCGRDIFTAYMVQMVMGLHGGDVVSRLTAPTQ